MRKTFITLLATVACFIAMNGAVFAEGSSSSFRLDYNRLTDSASQSSSSDYKLISGIPSISSDGDSASFKLRNIYHSSKTTTCGNNVIESGEQCEGSNFNGITCSSFGYSLGDLLCVNCAIDLSGCSNSGGGGGGYNPALCGNGYREVGEECDDGNSLSGDGCSSYCRIENHHCGNGILETGEQCDDGNVNTNDGCTPECKLEGLPIVDPVIDPVIDPIIDPIIDPNFNPAFSLLEYPFFKTEDEPKAQQIYRKPVTKAEEDLHPAAKEQCAKRTCTFSKWIDTCLLIWILIGIIITLSLALTHEKKEKDKKRKKKKFYLFSTALLLLGSLAVSGITIAENSIKTIQIQEAELHAAAETTVCPGLSCIFSKWIDPCLLVWILIGISIVLSLLLINKRRRDKGDRNKNIFRVTKVLAALIILIVPILSTNQANAITTTPASIIYEGKLLDNSDNPITTAHSFRVSLWSSGDMIVGDVDGAGAINTLSPAYSGWQEVRNIIPNSDGTFSFPLGQLVPLPEMYLNLHKFLQVEIKISTDPNTNYQSMDPTGDNGLDTDDRQLIGSSPFAKNADFLDNKEIGVSTGDLAILGAGDIWDIDLIPGGTNSNNFILDNDDTAVAGENIFLQFGSLLAKTLGFNTTNNWFEFSEDVNLNQHEIKDVVIDNLALAPATPISGQIYHNTADSGTYVYNGTVWENITANSGPINWGSLPPRLKHLALSPDYPNATDERDGTNNRGKLVLDFIDGGGTNKHGYYEWTTMQAGMQDMNIVTSFELPLDFINFTATPLSIDCQTSDAIIGTNKIDIELYDTNGNTVVLTGGSNIANIGWITNNITFSGTPTFTAGSKITLKIKLSSTNTGFARVSDIVFNYNGR